jgi:hypothetical protein
MMTVLMGFTVRCTADFMSCNWDVLRLMQISALSLTAMIYSSTTAQSTAALSALQEQVC